jgi:hypothetical protein
VKAVYQDPDGLSPSSNHVLASLIPQYLYPYPLPAHSPNPEDAASGVSVITDFSWSYTSDPDYPDPLGFYLRLATDSTMLDYEEYFLQGDVGENSFSRTGFLDFDTTYYWQIIPTSGRAGAIDSKNRSMGLRDSTPDCPIWIFSTEAAPSLAAPQNVRIEIIGSYLKLSWDAVPEASDYIIFATDDPALPLGEWEVVGNVSNLYWFTGLAQTKSFYYLKANN